MGISMKTVFLALAGTVAILASTPDWLARQKPLDRLPAEQFDAAAPSALVNGPPGQMSVRSSACRNLPTGEIRRRIVNVAVQEWGFFGFSIVDETIQQEERSLVRNEANDGGSRAWSRRRWWRVDPVEGARVASTIGGYWAATPDGSWMVDRQNSRWRGAGWLGLALARSLVRGIRVLGNVRGRTRQFESVPTFHRSPCLRRSSHTGSRCRVFPNRFHGIRCRRDRPRAGRSALQQPAGKLRVNRPTAASSRSQRPHALRYCREAGDGP